MAAEDSKVMVVYVNAMHDQLSLEHRQWQAQAIESPVEKLSQSLKRRTSKTEAKDETEGL